MGQLVYFDSGTARNLERVVRSSERIANALEELVQLQKTEYVTLKNKLANCQEDEKSNGR